MEKVTIEIIYHEGGDSYRPFLVVKAPPEWPVENIAYYQSSGRSNETNGNHYNYRKDTWFPTLGLLKQDTTLFEKLHEKNPQIYTDGYILKDSMYTDALRGNQISPWNRAFLIQQNIIFNEQYNTYGTLTQILSKKKEGTYTKEDHDTVIQAIRVIKDYCRFWWQIQLSARLGGGLWDRIPYFREFVLEYDYDDYSVKGAYVHKQSYEFEKRETPWTPFQIEKNTTHPKANADDVNEFLLQKKALFHYLLYENYQPRFKDVQKNIFTGERFEFSIPTLDEKPTYHSNKTTKKRKRETTPSPTSSPLFTKKPRFKSNSPSPITKSSQKRTTRRKLKK